MSHSNKPRAKRSLASMAVAGASMVTASVLLPISLAAATSGETVTPDKCILSGSTLEWEDENASLYGVRRVQEDGSSKWVADASKLGGDASWNSDSGTFTFEVPDQNAEYVIRHFHGGMTTLPCAAETQPSPGGELVDPVVQEPPANEPGDNAAPEPTRCSQSYESLAWRDTGAPNYRIYETQFDGTTSLVEEVSAESNDGRTFLVNGSYLYFGQLDQSKVHFIEYFDGDQVTSSCDYDPVQGKGLEPVDEDGAPLPLERIDVEETKTGLCQVEGTELTWTHDGASAYDIRIVDEGGNTSYVDTIYLQRRYEEIYWGQAELSPADETLTLEILDEGASYIVEHNHRGEKTLTCTNANIDTPPNEIAPTCVRIGNTLTWDDGGAGTYFVRRVTDGSIDAGSDWSNTKWVANSTELTYEVSDFDVDYVIQHFHGGKTTLPCQRTT